jgi:c-di-GMP-binding flagellar brake protein YcgR
MSMTEERRKRTRVPVSFELNVLLKGEKIKVQTNNISMTGVNFISPQAFKAGEKCTIDLCLNQDVHLSIEAKILRSKDTETIASFLVMDEETFYHLKRLLQFNAVDSDRIDKELVEPAFT